MYIVDFLTHYYSITMKTTLKYKIARLISRSCVINEDPTYEQLLEAIYNNQYKTLDKVPTETFFTGIINSFTVLPTVEEYNRILNTIKEVVKEALELSGIELTFTDTDWETLCIVEYIGWSDNETVDYYSKNPRSIHPESNKCLYRGVNGEKCAFARVVKDNYLHKLVEGVSAKGILESLGRGIIKDEYIPSNLSGENDFNRFWLDIQLLHDCTEYWNNNRLTVEGEERRLELIAEYK